MKDLKYAAVGIDLGTTYSAIAHLDETGRPVTLVNAEGELLTPSLVLIDEDDIIVGKEALKAIGTESSLIAECAKRDIGRRAYRKAISGNQFPPEVIEACILKKLKNDAARLIGDFKYCVITVPAFFDEPRRKATQDAGKMAGLNVLDIINEPTAAAISYGFRHGFLNEEGESTKPLNVLVYDLGGGTFDVTLMTVHGSEFKAIATDGDVELGGRDWDQRLIDYVAQQFQQEYDLDPREDEDQAARLWRECEDAKRTLSARSKTAVTCDYRGKTLRVELSQELLQELTGDLLDRTLFTTRQLLRTVEMDWPAIDRILLVGGSSRMPMVREALANLAGKPPEDAVSADEAVAHGAALRAGLLIARAQGQPPSFKIRNVNSHSLGILGLSRKTNRQQNVIVIPRNSTLPIKAKRIFKTQKANQRNVKVTIVEGEGTSPDACTTIGECVIEPLPGNLPALSPVEVFFNYGENGRLAVAVSFPGTENDKPFKQEIQRENGLSADQMDAWKIWIDDRMA
ncbi:Molecular chaperone DnaK [Planctomycetales bacterium 10988]|nr:Molecular chaperone DnaK [Planctomycetales bacterium 10988]